MESISSWIKKSDKETDDNIQLIQSNWVQQIITSIEGVSPMEELGLKYDKNNQKDLNELRNILSKNLTYPSSEISEIHMRANRLGPNDLKQNIENLNDELDDDSKICPCCGFMEQKSALSFKTNLGDVNHIGVSTYLFFETIKNLILLIAIMFIVFSGYALVTNLIASGVYQNIDMGEIAPERLSYEGLLAISVGSKVLFVSSQNKNAFATQCWLGVSVLVIWMLAFGWIKKRERQAQLNVDYSSKTASDYSLYFANLPKNMSVIDLENQLLNYQNSVKDTCHLNQAQEPIKIAKVNLAKPFYLDEASFDNKELSETIKEHDKLKDKFVDWIKHRQESETFKVEESERNLTYENFKNAADKKVELYKTITEEIVDKMNNKDDHEETVPAFITFNSTYNKEFLEEMHESQSYRYIYKIFPCLSKKKYFHYEYQDQNNNTIKSMASISQASEPEDIMWTNQGQSACELFRKRMLTYGVTLVILAVSFGIIYGLSNIQYQINLTQSNEFADTFLSVLMSLSITMTGIVIKMILKRLTIYERNPTLTQQQTSLGLKAAWATLINTILIPIMVNRFFKNNIFGINGLADDVFYLAITNSFVSPVLKIFDVFYFLSRFMKWYYNRPTPKLPLSQTELNSTTELMEFELGSEYVYFVNLFLFTCFFVSLQPIIPLFAILGMSIMYLATKFSLFNRSQRPTPGSNAINTAMFQLIYAGAFMYTMGSFCWSSFLSNIDSGITANIVAAVISGLIFIIPYKEILKSIVEEVPEENFRYQEDRIFLPSEYDRLNPSTSTEGIKDYMNYVADYKVNMKNKTAEEIQNVGNIFARQFGTGNRHRSKLMPNFGLGGGVVTYGKSSGDEMVIKRMLGGGEENSVNPMIIANTVMPLFEGRGYGGHKRHGRFKKNQINMIAQNWLTAEELNRNSYGQNNSNPLARLIQSTNVPQQEGETVTYHNQNSENNNQAIDGGLNLVFNTFENQGGRASGGHNTQENEIPMNLQANLFGNLLNNEIRSQNKRKRHDRHEGQRGRSGYGGQGGW